MRGGERRFQSNLDLLLAVGEGSRSFAFLAQQLHDKDVEGSNDEKGNDGDGGVRIEVSCRRLQPQAGNKGRGKQRCNAEGKSGKIDVGEDREEEGKEWKSGRQLFVQKNARKEGQKKNQNRRAVSYIR